MLQGAERSACGPHGQNPDLVVEDAEPHAAIITAAVTATPAVTPTTTPRRSRAGNHRQAGLCVEKESGFGRGRRWCGKCHNRSMRRFNTEGPVRPDDHYAIPPLDRVDVEELLDLIRTERYFVLHAPRQTGKTSALIALRDLLNSGEVGNFRCVHINVEVAQVARDDTASGIRAILSMMAARALLLGDDFLRKSWNEILAASGPNDALRDVLMHWCLAHPTPLVLLVDEIDSLVGDTLLSVLRQIRAGYEQRPEGFPQSVVLCGVRDIRDYRIRSSAGEVIAGGSPFNVAAKSLRMGDFTEAETRALMAQHTEETGQRFSPAALDAVWTQTRGQPWLVNALCAGACFDNKAGRDRSRTIEVDDVYAAREELIVSRRTHLDQLAHKLEEARVQRVVEPILSGGEARYHARDLEYVRDLGLIAQDSPPRIANPIYAEVVPRELGYVLQDSLDVQAAWYVDDDGGLNMDKLLTAFRTFFGEHSEHWLGRFSEYPEAGPQLILQAYLHRVVNGGGRIEREYGLGRGRTDLLVLWPREPGQPSDLWERFVVECKVLRDSDRKSLAGTIERGVEQTLGYMAKCGAEEGHLVVIDRRAGAKECRRSEATEGHRGGEGKAGGSEERRQDGGKVIVWTL